MVQVNKLIKTEVIEEFGKKIIIIIITIKNFKK
jgi:hypothetical protein